MRKSSVTVFIYPIEARIKVKIRYVADLEQGVGANMARRANQYVDLKDRKLTEFY